MSQPPAPNFTEQHGAAFHRGGTPVAAPNAFQQGPYFHYPQVPVGGIFPQQYPPQYIPAPPHSGYPLNIPNPQGVPYQAVPPMHAPPFLHPFPTSQAHATMRGPHHNVQHCQVEPAQQAPPRRATRGPLRDIQPSSLPGPGAPALSQPTRQRPNAEPRPGVYTYQVDVVEGSAKREFTAETDMPWLDFRRRAVGLLEYNEIELVYKVTGDSGRPSHLKTEADFNSAMARVCQKALSARSRPVGLEIRNTAKGPSKKAPVPKRKRDDDIPPSPTDDLNTQLRAFKQLSVTLKCEAHNGHCFVDRTLGKDNHRRLSHAEMTLWAKKISLGEASKYTPPHCLAFDRLLSKRPRHSASSSTVPEVHVTIQNITSDSGISGTSTLPAQFPGITTHVVDSQPSSLSQPEALGMPSTSSDDSNVKGFEFTPPFFGIPQSSDTPVTPPNISATLPRQATPSKIKASNWEASPLEPATGHNDSDTSMSDKFAELQPPFTQANKAASESSAESPSNSQGNVFWSSSVLESEGNADSIFPAIRVIIQGLEAEQPDVSFGDLEQKFLDAGITESPQILVLPEHVLCVVGELDLFHVRILRNYTRRIILPLLGFANTYDDPVPEPAEDQFSDSQDDADSADCDDEGQGDDSSDHEAKEGVEEWEL